MKVEGLAKIPAKNGFGAFALKNEVKSVECSPCGQGLSFAEVSIEPPNRAFKGTVCNVGCGGIPAGCG